jgi:NhaA family Na+:H+ antiporter
MEKTPFLSPVQKFIKNESFSGVLLFGTTILALILSNIPSLSFNEIWNKEIGVTTEGFELVKPLILWINDGLMAIFFFLIGLEIKREILIGELNSVKKASLPVFAAIGGMIIPLTFYLLINTNPETEKGWGIAMATDIAFTLAILTLLGKRVPLSLKIFLTAFAIIDDIGAVMVIAIFYTGDIAWNLLFYASILLAILYIMSYLKIHSRFVIFIVGIVVWYLFLKAGVHPTIAGILLAFAVPVRQRINEFVFARKLQSLTNKLTEESNTNKFPLLSKIQIETLDKLEDLTDMVQSPLQQLEHRLHKWVAFLIMPVFAFSNAGIKFSSNQDIDFALASTIAISLFAGKAVGVSIFSYLGIKSKLASLPENINFKQIIGVAVLSGVGFTMSLFISGLAFGDSAAYLNSAKIGIIAGSLASGIVGYLILISSSRKK